MRFGGNERGHVRGRTTYASADRAAPGRQTFSFSFTSAGKLGASHALQGTDTASSIRGDVITDGPFVETKEALGGFYVIEADDLDQATKIAGMVPARFGGVEVRPVMVFPEG